MIARQRLRILQALHSAQIVVYDAQVDTRTLEERVVLRWLALGPTMLLAEVYALPECRDALFPLGHNDHACKECRP